MSRLALDGLLRDRLYGTRSQAFWREWLGNSGHFFILKILSSLALSGWQHLVVDPASYALAGAMFLQAWILSRSGANRFWGNLLGSTIYTLVDWPHDGSKFWSDPTHLILWGSSIAIAILQGVQQYYAVRGWLIVVENILRSLMVALFYATISTLANNPDNLDDFFWRFWLRGNHAFLLVSLVLWGLFLGLQQWQVDHQQQQVRATAATLSNLATWGFGTHAVVAAMDNPAVVCQRAERTIVFMDIRGFTAWGEKNSPDRVAALLNRYYQAVEPAAAQFTPLRIALTGDEVMAIYEQPAQGLAAARAMQTAARAVLTPDGLGAGCGIHCGWVVEGFFGSDEVRTYTAIGDAVNTAKRLESLTPAGAITVSEQVHQALAPMRPGEPWVALSPLAVKGKSEPLYTWQLSLDG